MYYTFVRADYAAGIVAFTVCKVRSLLIFFLFLWILYRLFLDLNLLSNPIILRHNETLGADWFGYSDGIRYQTIKTK